jgi:hypothetical protein
VSAAKLFVKTRITLLLAEVTTIPCQLTAR